MDANIPVIKQGLAEIERLDRLLFFLGQSGSFKDKITILDQHALHAHDFVNTLVSKLLENKRFGIEEYVIKAVCSIGQDQLLFNPSENSDQFDKQFHACIQDLIAVESFYEAIGGVIGYQRCVLDLLNNQKQKKQQASFALYPPKTIDLSRSTLALRKAIIEGIQRQDKVAEFYPVGGVADRLQLKDQKTFEALPAASLIFLGKSLLKLLMLDLQAREYLHFKLFHKQVLSPVVMMTSNANNNYEHIKEICEKNGWFGRTEASFKLLVQPSVPTFTKEGTWCLKSPMKPLLKPGGHGVIWKLADQSAVFKWLQNIGKKKILVRQINNPMAGIDDGLFAFLGIGHLKNKDFGFACCPRLAHTKEGMNVLKVTKASQGLSLKVTNIEYCEFETCELMDPTGKQKSRYSDFPSNTNTLFADLSAVSQEVKEMPFPGVLVNFKEEKHYKNGEMIQEKVARLESTMQNIAEGFDRSGIEALTDKVMENFPVYTTFNKRRKTISATKKQASGQDSILETPFGCYFDFLQNMKELLKNHCKMEIPEVPSQAVFLKQGLPFLFHYHPALGPAFSVISQKISGGKIHRGSQMQLEIADIEMRSLDLKGSLLVSSKAIMGTKDMRGNLIYSDLTGQCELINVSIKNKGQLNQKGHLLDTQRDSQEEGLKILLDGHSRFTAENVTFYGKQTIKVPNGVSMRAFEKKGTLVFESTPLKQNMPFWIYKIAPDFHIKISRTKD